MALDFIQIIQMSPQSPSPQKIPNLMIKRYVKKLLDAGELKKSRDDAAAGIEKWDLDS